MKRAGVIGLGTIGGGVAICLARSGHLAAVYYVQDRATRSTASRSIAPVTWCVASPSRGAILVFAPSGGAVERIATPDFLTTNIAFGGADLRTAYITLGASGRLVSMRWPRPGLALLRVTECGDERSCAPRRSPQSASPQEKRPGGTTGAKEMEQCLNIQMPPQWIP